MLTRGVLAKAGTGLHILGPKEARATMESRSEQLRAAFSARLERVRGTMSDADFAQLAADMVSTAQRLEEIDARQMGRKTPIPGTLPTFKEPDNRGAP